MRPMVKSTGTLPVSRSTFPIQGSTPAMYHCGLPGRTVANRSSRPHLKFGVLAPSYPWPLQGVQRCSLGTWRERLFSPIPR